MKQLGFELKRGNDAERNEVVKRREIEVLGLEQSPHGPGLKVRVPGSESGTGDGGQINRSLCTLISSLVSKNNNILFHRTEE